MFYLIYVSTAVNKMDNDELALLLKEFRDNNVSLDITGMLLYKNKNFMQMLEGKKGTVLELYEKIKKDERHNPVLTIMMGDIPERNFENWSMGFCNMDQVESLPKYDDYIDDYIKEQLDLKSFQDDAEGALKFMKLFNEVYQE